MANVQQAPNMLQGVIAPDIQAQQMALARQQQLADMLRQQSITPIETGQMVTGAGPARAVPVTGLQALAKVLQGYMGGKMQRDNDAKSVELNSKMGAALMAQIKQYQNPQQSTPNPLSDTPQTSQGSGAPIDQSGLPPLSAAPQASPSAEIPINQSGNEPAQPAPPQPKQFTDPRAAALVGQGTSAPSGAPANISPQAPQANPLARYLAGSSYDQLFGPEAAKDFYSTTAPTELQKNDKYLNISPDQSRTYETDKRVKEGMITPVANRGDGMLAFNKQTGKWEVDPASLDATRQSQAIKGQFDSPVTLKTSTGQEIQLSKTEWANYQNNGGKLPARFLPPGKLDTLQSAVNQSGEPADISFSTPQGQVGGHLTPAGVGQIGVSQTPFGQALDKEEAGRVSKMTEDIYDKGTHALDKVAQNNKMIELLPQVTTGPLNKQITMLKNAAQSVGVDIGDPAPNQEFDKYAIQGALSAAKSIYGSRITNQDVTTQISSNPGATMGEKAIYQMLKWDNEARQREIQKMTAYGDYKRNGGDPREFQVYFAQKYPYNGVAAPENGKAADFAVPTPAAPAKPAKDNRPPIGSIIPVR